MTNVINFAQIRAKTKNTSDEGKPQELDDDMDALRKAKAKNRVAAILDMHPLRGSSW
jgi:hypothetical protein